MTKASEVSRETNLSNSIFLNKTERNKRFLTRNEVFLKISRIKLQKRRKTLKIKRKLRQSANILLEMGFVSIFISFFCENILVFINNCKSFV